MGSVFRGDKAGHSLLPPGLVVHEKDAHFDHDPTAADHGTDVLYRIEKSDSVGRYMVASRDIFPGEVIFTDQPACVGPDNSSKPMCLGCFSKVNGSYKCPGCKWPMCRESCTRIPAHRAECAIFQSRKAVVNVPWFDKPCAYYDAILPMRILFLKWYNPKVYRLVTLLMDHNDHLDEVSAKHRKRVIDFILKTCRLSKDFTEEEVNHVLGILTVNSFVVHDHEEDNLDLIGLYPWTSLMSHHCIANTKITTREDFSYVCQATTLIHEGQEIVTSYHHYHYQLYGTSYRRRDLKGTWSFECICKRCQDPTESGTLVSGVFCDSCRDGYLLPTHSTDFESPWRCQNCFIQLKSADIEAKVKKFEDEIDEIKGTDVEGYEKLLRRMKYALHENHYWILDVKRRLIDIWGNKPGFETYKLSKEVLEKKIEYCDQLLEMTAKLSPGPSELRGYLLWQSHGAQLRLTQWKWIRMRINTIQYLEQLLKLTDRLKEVVTILGPIRQDSDEGQMGLSAKEELQTLERLIFEMSKHRDTILASNKHPLSRLGSAGAGSSRDSSIEDSHRLQRRKSICL
ncbi:hypothetical protein TCAL_08645 [Tigriopus californicus]|uniref:SET domain-containing protein n=1 Tax=Tigriopus californicus TaxID=6832 RepID=A0A553PCS9_TIGCA|nr:SET domain-containing protein SmydA-8-like [Tigriopus californicus]TRY75492.1 hypothetical protein TCAL_08645 [Tigriopus californicus]|eukprot:TCALIF_08645-PA protein Name:"Similar to msta Protein msta, isoform A (Drosophila melanogaster)" AED:0.02 eAED:0.02 QI:276/1/1/1/0.75/0.6/5/235/567